MKRSTIPLVLAVLWTAIASAQNFELVHAFRRAGSPMGSLIQATDGRLYGATYWGGKTGVGTVFRLEPGGSPTTLHTFAFADGANPGAGLIQASDGFFYGTTTAGGESNHGTIFRVDASGNLTSLHSFQGFDGSYPAAALVEASDGNLYGTTSEGGTGAQGTIFRIDTAGVFTSRHSFVGLEGQAPLAAMIQATDGFLYGAAALGGAHGAGVVFKIDTGGTYTKVSDLTGANGSNPVALLQGHDGLVYGTARFGGASGGGALFRMETSGAGTTTLYSFDGTHGSVPVGLIQKSDGTFAGAAMSGGSNGYGTVFLMDAQLQVTTLRAFAWSDGAYPAGAPILAADGTLYGVTQGGGGFSGAGTIYGFGALHWQYFFPNPDPLSPETGLAQGQDGNLYGTTPFGGPGGQGTIFRLGLAGGFRTLHGFSWESGDGYEPFAPLVRGSDGQVYGTTAQGGANGAGTLFRLISDGTVATLYDFEFPGGGYAATALVEGDPGTFYGVGSAGGANQYGAAFSFDVATTSFTSLYSFTGAEGTGLQGLAVGPDGNLYGTMAFDGGGGYGTAYRLDLAGPTLDTIHDFVLDFTNGLLPHAPLIAGSDDSLYGTTLAGGLTDQGTVFRMDADGNLTTLHSFAFGSQPRSALIEADGDFFGTTSEGGAYGFGTVFRMTPSGELSTLHSFDGRDGDRPRGALLLASDGNLYGTTQEGGPAGDAGPGVVFRLTASAVAVNAVSPTSGPAAGASLTLLGGGFASGVAVMVGGEPLTGVNLLEPTFLYGKTGTLAPGSLNDVKLENLGASAGGQAATLPNAFFADFLDVPQHDLFHDYVETVFRSGVTAGCGSGHYCRNDPVTREQMAVFLLKSKHDTAYLPPACAGTFDDVVCPGQFTDWIEQLAAEGITGGCGGNNYCPADPVTRAQLAVFLLKTEHGSSHVPPPCGGIFGDVTCPSLYANWIEELYGENVTSGCQASPLLYCPGSSSTRGQMAVFLVKTFGL